jgi:exopolyphosphatase/guanosine-5'-triphosphate,3'-diphosphate pyrophosphatase
MLVGVVDVGANTARLLVAEVRDGSVRTVRETRAPVGLGDQIERRGEISPEKIREVVAAVGDAAATARAVGVADLTVLVTSPGRQSANGDELARAIGLEAGVRVRSLSAAEEARLAYLGALSSIRSEAQSIAVCDVGGGSAQIAIGHPRAAPIWIRSIDVGSLRLTRRHIVSDPPRRRELNAARCELDRLLTSIMPPEVSAGLATGGTARSLEKLVGDQLGVAELAEALEIVTRRKAKEIERRYGVPRWRARLLPAGTAILAAIQHELGVDLTVARGGLREGAALELAEHLRIAA